MILDAIVPKIVVRNLFFLLLLLKLSKINPISFYIGGNPSTMPYMHQ